MTEIRINEKQPYGYGGRGGAMAAFAWATDRFGPCGHLNRRWYYYDNHVFKFENEKDATMFALVWVT